MKRIFSGALMATTMLAAVSVKAQTADEIVSKYIDAIGGMDKLKQVNSVYMEGTVQVMGMESPTSMTILNGKGYKTESTFNGQKVIQCVTDQGGWSVNPMGGGGAEPMQPEQYKTAHDQIYVGGALFDYAAKGSTVELLGKEGNAYKLKLVTKDKAETTFFIDAGSWYITKAVRKGNMGGQEVEVNLLFSDYRKTDFGYVLPFTIQIDLGQFTLTNVYKKVEINKPVDPAVFVMPK